MNIQEVEQKTGLERGNIRFYEKEGLLHPARQSNGYRDYSQEDIQTLLRIKLLRQLNISLGEIGQMQQQPERLQEALSQRLEDIRLEGASLARAEEICRAIRDTGVGYDRLAPESWLRQMEQPLADGAPPRTSHNLERDVTPVRPHPWRRFLARYLDMALYHLLLLVLLFVILNLYPMNDTLFQVISYLFGVAALFALEPLMLSRWGTTPGKWLLGLRVTNLAGGRLSYGQALERLWGVFSKGEGYSLPVYSLYRSYKSYRSCQVGEPLDWEDESCCVAGPLPYWRCVAWGGALTAVFLISVALPIDAMLPNARAPLTVARYAENFNDMRRQFLPDYRYEMDAGGNLVEQPLYPEGTVITIEGDLAPESVVDTRYQLDGDILTGITITVSVEDDAGEEMVFGLADNQITLATLAFVGAQKEVGFLSGGMLSLLKQLPEDAMESFDRTIYGVRIRRTVESAGYWGAAGLSLLLPEEDAAEHYYHMTYTMELVE
ncbi:MerR family transcriptional regulator [Angelakisella massiliensis]|uniref:MerR family transcriptional regulator n=1 Tax=Angelakisella massiliensis TaxID=1871018 RepID=UPI0023A7C3D6|nr:MerR family transcriptional regulator [Angelakisella massiliensis]